MPPVSASEREAVAPAETESGDGDAPVDPGLTGEVVDARLEGGDGPGPELGD